MVSKLTLLCSIYHMFLVPLYGVQTVIAVLHLPYVPRAPVWCPTCHCCAPSTICSLCPCMVPKLSLLCSIYHMFLVPLYGAQTVIAVLHLPYVPCAPVWCPNCHCCAPSTICSLCPLYGAQTVIAVLHLPYVPCAPVWCPNCHCCVPSTICSVCPCMAPKLSLLCSIYHVFLVPLYGVQPVIAVLHLPSVHCAPVWCPTCHCCAPSTICSLCPCMAPKLSLLCSIYHMFLVPLYGAQTVIAVLHLPYVPCALCMVSKLSLLCSIYHICSLCPCMVSKLSLLCSIYHMFLVPLYGVQTVIDVLHLPYVPCAPVWCPNCHCCAPSTICSLCPCMVSQTVIAVFHLPYVPYAPVWRPNCHCCAPSTICSLCPCMVPKLSLLCSIYHMFLVPLYGAQTVIAVLHLPYVSCAPVWCPNCHCCAPSTICSLCPLYGAQTVIAVLHLPYVPCAPCMVSKLSLLCSIYHMCLVPLYGVQTVIAVLHLPYVPFALYGVQTVIDVLHLPYVPCSPVWCPN